MFKTKVIQIGLVLAGLGVMLFSYFSGVSDWANISDPKVYLPAIIFMAIPVTYIVSYFTKKSKGGSDIGV